MLAGHEDDPGPSALALRLLGSVHRLVLERRAGALATYYPSVGRDLGAEGGWAAFRALLAEHPDDGPGVARPAAADQRGGPRHRALRRAAAAAAPLGDLPVRLVEIGSSAGLNLRADHFAYRDDAGRRFGARRRRTLVSRAPGGDGALEPWPA